MKAAGFVAEAAGQGVFGDDAQADFIGYEHNLFRAVDERGFEGGDIYVVLGQHQITQPQGQAVDQDRRLGSAEGAGEVDRLLDSGPAGGGAVGAVRGDAGAHLVVEGLGGGDVGAEAGSEERLGVAALAGAGAAENEGEIGQETRL